MSDHLPLPVSALGRRALAKASAALAAATTLPLSAARAQSAARARTLVVASSATPQSMDVENALSIGSRNVMAAFYDNLTRYPLTDDPRQPGYRRENFAVAPEGQLAERWEWSPDNRKITFVLRDGVRSGWGNPLTAEDVKYTFDRKFAIRGRDGFMTRALGMADPEQVRVEGPRAVSFSIERPNAIFLPVTTHIGNPIFDQVKCKEMAAPDDPWSRRWLDTNVAGFGPYTMRELTRGQQMVAIARDDYWGGKPFMETVIFREVATSAARLSLVQGGAADVAQFLAPTDYIALASHRSVRVANLDATQGIWIQMNTRMPPFDNPLVRRAMNFAFPRDEVLRTVLQGFGAPLKGVMPLFFPGATDQFWEYDTNIDTARRLLAEAGLASGFKTELSYNAGVPEQEPIAIMFQTALRPLGIEVQLNRIPAATYFRFMTDRSQPLMFHVDGPFTPDPSFALNLYFRSTSFINHTSYTNAEVDALVDRSLTTMDWNERRGIVTRAQQIVMRESPWVHIAFTGYQFAHQAALSGLAYYSSNTIRFQDVRRGGA
jgi:peptide/nickel transport system substrate-binding protein